MLPILQSSSVASVRSSSAEDVVDASDSAKDFERSDLFAALVGESASDEQPKELPEEKVIPEASDELAADADEARQQGEPGEELDDRKTVAAVSGDNDGKSAASKQGFEAVVIADVDQNLSPVARRTALQSEFEARAAEATPNSNQTGASAMANVAQEQQGQNGTVEAKHALAVSAAFATVESRASGSGSEGLTEMEQGGMSNPKAQVATSASQSGSQQPANVHAASGLPDGTSPRMRGEPIQTDPTLLSGEKPNGLPAPERSAVSPQSQPVPVLASVANSALPQIHPLEPRHAPHSRRASEGTPINSSSTLEFEARSTANRPLINGQAPVPNLTNGPVTISQTTNPMLENDDGLRAGLTTTREHHLQSNPLEAIHRGAPAQSTELPRSIARQLAEASQRMPDRPVEVALNPEELGRVRMSISTHDTGITLALLAERPETLDLMRRHIDQLTQEFHALGFGDVRFSFSQNNESDGGGADSTNQDSSAHADESSAQAPIQLSMGPSVGLDIRL